VMDSSTHVVTTPHMMSPLSSITFPGETSSRNQSHMVVENDDIREAKDGATHKGVYTEKGSPVNDKKHDTNVTPDPEDSPTPAEQSSAECEEESDGSAEEGDDDASEAPSNIIVTEVRF
jgi:hypothetical protein